MPSQPEGTFKLFRIDAGLFSHQSHVICTVFRNPGGYLKSESFVLIQLSQTEGAVFGSKFSYSNNTDQKLPVAIDEQFAVDDALFQAESIYSMEIHKIIPTLSSQSGWRTPSFMEIPQHRLVSIWAHTPLNQALLRVADLTECVQLSKFIYALQSVPTTKHSSLVL